jgi:hypothetical protein
MHAQSVMQVQANFNFTINNKEKISNGIDQMTSHVPIDNHSGLPIQNMIEWSSPLRNYPPALAQQIQ